MSSLSSVSATTPVSSGGPRPRSPTERHRTRLGRRRGAARRPVRVRWSCRCRPGPTTSTRSACPATAQAACRLGDVQLDRAARSPRPGSSRAVVGEAAVGPGDERRPPGRGSPGWSTPDRRPTRSPGVRRGAAAHPDGIGRETVDAPSATISSTTPSSRLDELRGCRRRCRSGRRRRARGAAPSAATSTASRSSRRSPGRSSARAALPVDASDASVTCSTRFDDDRAGSCPSWRDLIRPCAWRSAASTEWALAGRLSMTASRSSLHRSRGVGSRPIVSTNRSSLSSIRRRTSAVRVENSTRTSSGTSRISAMPCSGCASGRRGGGSAPPAGRRGRSPTGTAGRA